MKALLKVAFLSFKQQTAYRVALWAGLFTNLFFGFLRVALIVALYQNQSSVNQVSVEASVTFVALSQGLIAFCSVFGDLELMRAISSGEIGAILLKPTSLFNYWLARDFGKSQLNLWGRGVLLVAIFGLFYSLVMPTSLAQWGFFGFSLFLGWLLSFAWRFIVNIAAFWLQDAMGWGRLAFILTQIFSGFFLPLRLLPDWFILFSRNTPFPYMITSPIEIFLGINNTWTGMISEIALQMLWLFVLYLIAQGLMRAGLRHLVIQGG
jgi:ABC-2 type transport system permease protein